MLGRLEQGMGVPFLLRHQGGQESLCLGKVLTYTNNGGGPGEYKEKGLVPEYKRGTLNNRWDFERAKKAQILARCPKRPRAQKKSLGEVSPYKATLV